MELNKIPADWGGCRDRSICCSRVICIKLSAVVPFDYIRLVRDWRRRIFSLERCFSEVLNIPQEVNCNLLVYVNYEFERNRAHNCYESAETTTGI